MSVDAPTVSQNDILNGLRETGIVLGDTVMVHSSLSSFGKVDGGPEAVIDALLEAVGPVGHVVMPSLTATYTAEIVGCTGLAFNPKVTPSRVGKITDLFWRRPNAVRSTHPTHAVACIGPQAMAWMAGHDKGSTFSWDTAYGKYVHSGGKPCKLVFMGVTMVCNTTLHAVEDWLGLPYLGASAAVTEVNGEHKTVEVTCAPHGCRGFYKAEDRHHKLMLATGLIRTAQVGKAKLSVIDARACIAETIRQELAAPGALLCDRKNCQFCTEGRAGILPIQKEVRARAQEVRGRGLSA